MRKLLRLKRERETHGMSGTKEYGVWRTMISRCYDPNSISYFNYGAKSVTVCVEWRRSFIAFFKYVGPRPNKPNMTIERIKSDKGYEPGNVRWATRQEQSDNRPTFNRKLTCRGRILNLSQWAKELGIKRTTLRMRLDNCKWPLEQALFGKES